MGLGDWDVNPMAMGNALYPSWPARKGGAISEISVRVTFYNLNLSLPGSLQNL